MQLLPAAIPAALLLALGTARAEPRAPTSGSCACSELLAALVEKVETNYPGYHLEVKGTAREASYRRHVAATRTEAAVADEGLACVAILQEFVAWFEEGHLFVGGRPPVRSAADSARLRVAAPRVPTAEAEVLDYLRARGRRLDPVEGIWTDPAGLKLAIVRDAIDDRAAGIPLGPERFVAFVLESTMEQWRLGDVKAELVRLPDGSYDAVLYDDVRAPTRPHVYKRGVAGGARLQRDGLLLHMPPTTWGKLHPLRPGQEGLIDPVDPRAPTARTIGSGVVVFHVPSNVPTHARRLRALVEQHRSAIGRAETLVIDLRGNEGGSAFVTNVFMPFLSTSETRPPRYLADGEMAVLATSDNAAHFARLSWAPSGLVERLRSAPPGTLVPFADPDTADPAEPEPTTETVALPHPRNVAILTDAMTVSAAEAFVLKAMRHGKVTLFGEATGSSIDYQTVGIVRFGCPDAGLYVGYPTIVGSDRLPAGGVRPTGIVPDVPLDRNEPDPVLRILEHYRGERDGNEE